MSGNLPESGGYRLGPLVALEEHGLDGAHRLPASPPPAGGSAMIRGYDPYEVQAVAKAFLALFQGKRPAAAHDAVLPMPALNRMLNGTPVGERDRRKLYRRAEYALGFAGFAAAKAAGSVAPAAGAAAEQDQPVVAEAWRVERAGRKTLVARVDVPGVTLPPPAAAAPEPPAAAAPEPPAAAAPEPPAAAAPEPPAAAAPEPPAAAAAIRELPPVPAAAPVSLSDHFMALAAALEAVAAQALSLAAAYDREADRTAALEEQHEQLARELAWVRSELSRMRPGVNGRSKEALPS